MKTLPALFLALTMPALGRLGETKDQMFERYGSGTPMEISTQGIEGFRYRAGMIEVAVLFLNGKSVAERFDGAWGEKAVVELLKSFSGGKPWTGGRANEKGIDVRWFGKLRAYVMKDGPVIISTEADYAALEKAANPADLELFRPQGTKETKGKSGKGAK